MAKSVSDFARKWTEPEDPEYNVFSDILNSNVATIFDIDDEDENMDDANAYEEMDDQGAHNDDDHRSKEPSRPVKKEPVTSSNSNIMTAGKVNSQLDSQACSSSSLALPNASSSDSLFISRIRQIQPSTTIPMNQNYSLLGLRYFQQIQGMDVCLDGYQPVELTVASFNVLCQSSLEQTRHLYRHLYGQRQQNLQWENRLPKLQMELDRLAADVFCLQEIQDCHFEQFFQPYFLQRGYEGLFKRRTGNPPDGCAIFWRSNRLELLKSRSIAYNLGMNGMNRDNVGQICIFGIRGFGTSICISNTHIYFNMKKGDIKLGQIAYLLASMDQMEKEFLSGQNSALVTNKQTSSNNSKSPPPPHHHYVHFAGHILCGDFNIYPGSPLHRFLLDRQINLRSHSLDLAVTMETGAKRRQQTMLSYLDQSNTLLHPLPVPFYKMGISGDNCTFVTSDRVDLSCTELCHQFKFASVYEHWNIEGEPELSSYHVDAIQPDYIFYTVSSTQNDQKQQNLADGNADNMADFASENFIQLWKRLSLPTRAQFNLAGGPIPNEQHGSDHLSLWAGFRILCLPIVSETHQPPKKSSAHSNLNEKRAKN